MLFGMDLSSTWSSRIRLTLGIFLVLTAILKGYGLLDSTASLGFFSLPWVQIVAVEWELFLGLWLIAGNYVVGAWITATLTFVFFGSISLYLGWIGQASCSCFGVIKTSPWFAFGIDLTALVLLLVIRPPLDQLSLTRQTLKRPFLVIAGLLLATGGTLTALSFGASWIYGSPAAALA